MKLLRVVDETPDTLAVLLQKMLRRDLERFMNALANRDARHDDDELAPPKSLVQLEHRLDVAVGLASARFHFDVEIDRAHLRADDG